MIINWIKLYGQYFRKNFLFSILNILGLSIGLAALLLVLMYWQNEHSYNQWNPYKERVFEVEGGEDSRFSHWFPAPVVNYLEKIPTIVEAYNLNYSHSMVSSIEIDNKQDFLYDIREQQANFFEFFPFETIYGSAQDYKDNYKDALAIDLDQSERLFGKGVNPVGKTVKLNDEEENNGKILVIRYVFRIPGNSSVVFKALTSYLTEAMVAQNKEGNWGDHNYTLMIKLKQGKSIEEYNQNITDVLYEEFYQRYAEKDGIDINEAKEKYKENSIIHYNSVDKVHLNPISGGLGGGPTLNKMLNIMLGSAILLLVLSVVNAINLSLVNSLRRAKEIGVRKAMGATKGQLFLQFLFESVITVVAASLLSLFFVELILPYFNLLVSRAIVFNLFSVWPILLALAIIIILLLAILPTIFILSLNIIKVLKGSFKGGKSGTKIRNLFLIIQFFIAFFFLSTAILINKQVDYILNEDLGFNGNQVINIKFKITNVEKRRAIYNLIESDVNRIEGVKGIAIHAMNIGGGYSSGSTNIIEDRRLQSGNVPVGYDFLKVFEGKLVEGRFFDRNFASDSINKVVVNESFKREAGFADGVIGKKIIWNDQEFEVIGVVKDMKVQGASQNTTPVTYFMPSSVSWFTYLLNTIAVRIDDKNVDKTLKNLEQFWQKRIDKVYPMEYTFASDDYATTYKKTLYLRTLFLSLMGVSIFIALLGLMAIVSFTVESKLKQIAIRKVLGANKIDLIINLSKQFIAFCVIGFLLSIYPVIFVMNLWLEDFVYRIDIDVIPFIIAFVVLLSFSLALVCWKSWQATRVNILKYVNYE